jgi:hypothetical protein
MEMKRTRAYFVSKKKQVVHSVTIVNTVKRLPYSNRGELNLSIHKREMTSSTFYFLGLPLFQIFQ